MWPAPGSLPAIALAAHPATEDLQGEARLLPQVVPRRFKFPPSIPLPIGLLGGTAPAELRPRVRRWGVSKGIEIDEVEW